MRKSRLFLHFINVFILLRKFQPGITEQEAVDWNIYGLVRCYMMWRQINSLYVKPLRKSSLYNISCFLISVLRHNADQGMGDIHLLQIVNLVLCQIQIYRFNRSIHMRG